MIIIVVLGFVYYLVPYLFNVGRSTGISVGESFVCIFIIIIFCLTFQLLVWNWKSSWWDQTRNLLKFQNKSKKRVMMMPKKHSFLNLWLWYGPFPVTVICHFLSGYGPATSLQACRHTLKAPNNCRPTIIYFSKFFLPLWFLFTIIDF